jgi:hypothetical protein
MELVLEEAAVTIKVVSVGGKRMPKALYNQLPRQSLLNDHDCTVHGRPWGIVLDPKCCHDGRWAHWHVLHEKDGELAVWNVAKDAKDAADYNLRPGASYEPLSKADVDFIDACALETHQGGTGFFQGKVFDLVREQRIVTTIEDVKVYLACSSAVDNLRLARNEHADAVAQDARWEQIMLNRPYDRKTEKAEAELKAAEDTLRTAWEQRGKSAQELYADLVDDVRRIKQARVNYAAALAMIQQLPQLFLGA